MAVIHITDFGVPELDVYARLNEAQLLNSREAENGLFIAESPKVIERALDAGYEPVSMLVETKHIEGEAAEVIARCPGIPVFTAPFEVLTQLTGYMLTRGVLCAMKRKPLPSFRKVCENISRAVIMENIMNPTNIGAIFRGAAALGFDAVILSPDCSNPLYRRAVRVSMGTVFQIPWTITEVPYAIRNLKSSGFAAAAMALCDDSVGIDDAKLNSEEKIALVLGSEETGLRDETIESCDYTVKIPMHHGVDSLNVGAAAAVAFWQLGKK